MLHAASIKEHSTRARKADRGPPDQSSVSRGMGQTIHEQCRMSVARLERPSAHAPRLPARASRRDVAAETPAHRPLAPGLPTTSLSPEPGPAGRTMWGGSDLRQPALATLVSGRSAASPRPGTDAVNARRVGISAVLSDRKFQCRQPSRGAPFMASACSRGAMHCAHSPRERGITSGMPWSRVPPQRSAAAADDAVPPALRAG